MAADAFLRRRRAIRHRGRDIELSRQIEATPDGVLERLNVDLSPRVSRRSTLRLSLWPDGVGWICASRGRPKAPGIRGAVQLVCTGVAPGTLCALFERSLSVADTARTSADIEEALMQIWAACTPGIDPLD
jgi:hypothetical protein